MDKNELMQLFGLTEQDFDKVVGSASELITKLVNEAMKNEETNSYFNTKGYEYKNGKLKKKFEKEYVNGECVKDTNYDAGKHNLTTNRQNINKLQCEIEELKAANENYRKQIGEMTTYIDGLNDKTKKLTFENAELKSVLDNIKSAFN